MTTETFVREMNKKFGKEVAFTANHEKFKVKKIPTGILSLDILLHGGIALGRWIEVYGVESVLKTTIMLKAIAEGQRRGWPGFIADVEQTLDEDFMKMRGVDTSPNMLNLFRTDIGEEYIDAIKFSMENGIHKIIGIDSIASLLPKRESEGKMETQAVGSQGLLTSKMGRMLIAANKYETALILVNQTREKIGISFGDPTTTPGGRAPKFYSSQRIRLDRIETKRESNEGDTKNSRGHRHQTTMQIAVTLEKNKTGGTMGGETIIHYDIENNRIDEAEEIIANGLITDIIKKQGTRIKVGNTLLFRKDFKEMIVKKPKLMRKLKQQILEKAIG